eukprot:COSAG02_NODE_41464_length_394_cov_1.044068_1_plen_62_part_01
MQWLGRQAGGGSVEMMTPRAVPWLDWAEWETVRELLMAPEPGQRARGVQRVAAWRSRGRLPV